MTANNLAIWTLLTAGEHPGTNVDFTILTFVIVVGIIAGVILNVRGN